MPAVVATVPAAASWRAPRSLGQGQALLALGITVHVGVDRNALTRASLTAYTLPLVTMLMSASALQEAGNGVTIAACTGRFGCWCRRGPGAGAALA